MVTVDTHVVIWEALLPEKLSLNAKNAFDKARKSDGILLCDISLWEISMMLAKKRIEIDISYLEFISMLRASRNYILQPITPEIAFLSTTVCSQLNADPADRLIVATALATKTPLITVDKNIIDSGIVHTIW